MQCLHPYIHSLNTALIPSTGAHPRGARGPGPLGTEKKLSGFLPLHYVIYLHLCIMSFEVFCYVGGT